VLLCCCNLLQNIHYWLHATVVQQFIRLMIGFSGVGTLERDRCKFLSKFLSNLQTYEHLHYVVGY